jgi:uncharacterized alkaline shock family protein YloU
MWFLTRMAIIFYVTILWVTSIAAMLFVMHQLEFETVSQVLKMVYTQQNARILVGCIAIGIVLVSILLENLIYGRRRAERTIAFVNPSGPVTVSLSAIEDLVKRLIVHVPEALEIRPHIIATKKGLHVDIKLTLRHEANIPDLTGRLQDLVRCKIEEAIGMEDKVDVLVHVIKISLDDLKLNQKGKTTDAQVPFHGYRT